MKPEWPTEANNDTFVEIAALRARLQLVRHECDKLQADNEHLFTVVMISIMVLCLLAVTLLPKELGQSWLWPHVVSWLAGAASSASCVINYYRIKRKERLHELGTHTESISK
jgi:Na+/glutamate symporter